MQPFSEIQRLTNMHHYFNTDIKMKSLTMVLASATLLLSANGVFAEDPSDDSAESTIRLMGVAEAQLPDAVTKDITLPPAVAEDSAAVAKAAFGLETADVNRDRREGGLTRAEQAREARAEMAAEANDNRENRGRSDDRPGPPDRPVPPGK